MQSHATPTRNSIDTLIHEFGHRFETRFLSSKDRERFIKLSEVGDERIEHFTKDERLGFADEFIALKREHRADNFPEATGFLSPRMRLYWKAIGDKRSDLYDEYRKLLPLQQRFMEGDDSVIPEMREAFALGRFGGTLEVKTNPNATPLAVSDYGSTDWRENFAEAFLAQVTGRPMPEPIAVMMSALS